jgi:hypothetical protein
LHPKIKDKNKSKKEKTKYKQYSSKAFESIITTPNLKKYKNKSKKAKKSCKIN